MIVVFAEADGQQRNKTSYNANIHTHAKLNSQLE
jgi:hypothetical protein